MKNKYILKFSLQDSSNNAKITNERHKKNRKVHIQKAGELITGINSQNFVAFTKTIKIQHLIKHLT